jgi:hypothetical protein
MKRIAKKLLLFQLPFIIAIVVFISTYEVSGGDLNRIGYYSVDPNYRNQVICPPSSNSALIDYKTLEDIPSKVNILTIGDSFIQTNYGFQKYMFTEDNETVIVNISSQVFGNPYQMLYSLINDGFFERHEIDVVILQSVERASVIRASDLQIDQGVILNREPNDLINNENNLNKLVKLITDSLNFVFFNLEYNDFLDFNLSPAGIIELNDYFFSVNDSNLLYYKDDLNNRVYNNNLDNITILNQTINDLSSKLIEHQTELVFIIAPDKSTVYSDYTNFESKSDFALLFDLFDKDYHYIDSFSLFNSLLVQGTKDLYYFDDTHWSCIGAYEIAKEIEGLILVNDFLKHG